MPFYEWNPSLLSVHVQEMDSEHQVLIQKMNLVYDCFKASKPRTEIEKAVLDFAAYTVNHFTDEEAYMEKVGFDGVGTHKIIHQQLLKEVTKHLDHFKQTGVLTDGFFSFLGVWLTSHIRGIDMKYGTSKAKVA